MSRARVVREGDNEKKQHPMKGIRRYSHTDRQQVVEEMIPLIQKKFGENLLALAASASYAREEEAGYSEPIYSRSADRGTIVASGR